MTASITKDAAVDLQLAEGQPATVLIKSTEVAIGVGDRHSAAEGRSVATER